MKYVRTFILAVCAGVCIGIGGAVYLSVENKLVGAFLFSIGLIMIVTNGFALFTGRVGYALSRKPVYVAELCVVWLGNLCGTSLAAGLLRAAGSELSTEALCEGKLSRSPAAVFILALFCGILMYLAVNGYKCCHEQLGKYLSVTLCVAVFILCGFEHCVADMFYFMLGGARFASDPKTWLYLFIMTLGNSAGSLLFAAVSGMQESKGKILITGVNTVCQKSE